jgi:hypothetical protein
MEAYRLIAVVNCCVLLFLPGVSQQDDPVFDQLSLVAAEGSVHEIPVGYSFFNYGPFIASGKIWVFYNNGGHSEWRTRDFDENGDWSDGNSLYPANESMYFNMAFDGRYFHFIRAVDGVLMYRRGEAMTDGTIAFDEEVVAYTDPVWQLRSTNGVVPRHYNITVDSDSMVWIVAKVGNGNQITDEFKPIAIASIASDGGWQNRDGFPTDLAPTFNIRGNGRAPNIVEISPSSILFTWANDRASTSNPEHGLMARLWSDGEFGPIEVTGLPRSSANSSIAVPEEGIALVNSTTGVARRNANGEWEIVSPPQMSTSDWNVLTNSGHRVRLWDVAGTDIRYSETVDNGDTWGTVAVKWTLEKEIYQFNGTPSRWDRSSHHALLIAAGAGPYDIHMGMDGTAGVTGIDDDTEDIPTTFSLLQNYPNPFNPYTTIRYGVPARSHVNITVYNMLGQKVGTLVDGMRDAGSYETVFDASALPSGAYIYRLLAEDYVESRKLLYLK